MITRALKGLLRSTGIQSPIDPKAELYRNMIRREARMGGDLFGPPPAGVRREFFCLDEHTIVWHEEWHDTAGRLQVKSVRYDVRPSGVLKTNNNGQYLAVSRDEVRRLAKAMQIYSKNLRIELYPFATV